LQGHTTGSNRFDMPKDALLRLLTDAKEIGVKSIAFVGEGENTLNESLYDGLEYAKLINLDVSLATNGLRINKERIEDMMSSLVWIRFNISAATPDSYFKIHGVRRMDWALNNIKSCVDIKRNLGLRTTIGLQMVVLHENVNDIVPLAKLGRDLGVDYLVIKPCSDTYERTLDSPMEEYLQIDEIFQEADNYSDDNYVVSVKWKKIENLGLKDFKICYGTQFIIAISGDGSVFPCGHFFDIRRDEFKIGNVIESSLKDIIFGDRYRQVQKKIQMLDVNRECESNCRQYYINQFLWKLKNPPSHVNFI
ncbi:hypothetical protein LCGC14_2836340, partial [marine sediment metagenome]